MGPDFVCSGVGFGGLHVEVSLRNGRMNRMHSSANVTRAARGSRCTSSWKPPLFASLSSTPSRFFFTTALPVGHAFVLLCTVQGKQVWHTIVDATTCGNVSRFFNHSCEPTLSVFVVSEELSTLS